MNYHIWTIGCQMNQADSGRAAEELESMGWEHTGRPEDADLVLLNTCVVRQSAEDKARGRLGSLKNLRRNQPQAAIVVMGCLVDEDVEALRRSFPFVELFLRPSDIDGLISFAAKRWGSSPSSSSEADQDSQVCRYITVIEGCDHHCTYCIVRLRRGREQSRPIDDIVEEARRLVRRGAREVTLLGQNVDAYGHDLPGQPDLADLLRAVQEVDDLWRVRFLTSHPSDMSKRIIDAVVELEKVCEHIELPVQAGHDLTLKRMGRGYTVDQYRCLLGRIRGRMPDVAVATDIIVGFPGETSDRFQATYDLLVAECFDVVHAAVYSRRPGTPASRLEDDVPLHEKERRRRLVEELQRNIAGDINRQLLDSTMEVLVEEKHRGRWKGRSRSNKLVFFADDGDWRGRLAQVKITWAGPWSLQGEVIGPQPMRG